MSSAQLLPRLNNRIEARLNELGLTPITAALRAGLDRDAIRNTIRGSAPRIDTLVDVAAALQTSVGYLVGETDDPRPAWKTLAEPDPAPKPENVADELSAALADNLRRRMADLGLSQYAAAKKAGVGDDYVRDILRGKVKSPGFTKFRKLADALETTPAALMGEGE